MQCLWKKLLIILFLNSIFFGQLQAIEINDTKLLILDKSSSSKYELEFSNSYQFRNLSFEKKGLIVTPVTYSKKLLPLINSYLDAKVIK